MTGAYQVLLEQLDQAIESKTTRIYIGLALPVRRLASAREAIPYINVPEPDQT